MVQEQLFQHQSINVGSMIIHNLLVIVSIISLLGLVLASGTLIARSAEPGVVGMGLLLLTVVLNLRTQLHPLWLILLGGVLGLSGFV